MIAQRNKIDTSQSHGLVIPRLGALSICTRYARRFGNRLSRLLSFLQDPESTRAATQLSGEFTGGMRTLHYGQPPSARFVRHHVKNRHIPNVCSFR